MFFSSRTFETPVLGAELQDKTSSSFFQWGTLTDVIHRIKYIRPSPSVFAYCKHSKTGSPGNEARLDQELMNRYVA